MTESERRERNIECGLRLALASYRNTLARIKEEGFDLPEEGPGENAGRAELAKDLESWIEFLEELLQRHQDGLISIQEAHELMAELHSLGDLGRMTTATDDQVIVK
jgi:hypothetical protein